MNGPLPVPGRRGADGRVERGTEDAFRRYAERFGRSLETMRDGLRAGDSTPSEVARRLGLPAAAAEGPGTFFADFSAPRGLRHVRVCGATACFAATGGQHLADLSGVLGVAAGGRSEDGSVSLQEVRCLGYCYAGPAALDGELACVGTNLTGQLLGVSPRQDPPIPFHCDSPVPVVTAGVLEAAQPWSVWPGVVASGTPDQVMAEVAAARLRGRGGAGFRTALKWQDARAQPAPRIVVANGDEGDPGSYADRLLMELDPHRVLEGLALACFAVGAENGIIFVRSEYPRAFARLQEAVLEARSAGHLGAAVHGSGFSLEVQVVEGAGSYVSGEETALLNGLEGLRGVVRPRPPYPTQHGLRGRPTVVNNVETLAAIPWIVYHGGAAYAALGTPEEPGTMLVCLSERFRRPGAYEVQIGMSVRRVVDELGGGLQAGAELRALQVGGPLGGFLGPEDMDMPLSEAALSKLGAALGHAGIVAFDQLVSGEQVLGNLWKFAEAESCGQCSPCRVGTRRGRDLAQQTAEPDVRAGRAHVLRTMAGGSLCAFGRRVPAAVRSLARVYGLEGWPL